MLSTRPNCKHCEPEELRSRKIQLKAKLLEAIHYTEYIEGERYKRLQAIANGITRGIGA